MVRSPLTSAGGDGLLGPIPMPPPSSGLHLLRNLGPLAIASALTKVLVFGTNLGVGRLLGPTQFGQFTSAQTLAMVGSLLADLGLTVATTGAIVRERRTFSRLVSTTIAVQLMASILFAGIMASGVLLSGDSSGTGRLVLLMVPLPLVLALNATFALQAVEDMTRVAAVRVTTVVVTTCGTISTAAFFHKADGPAIAAWLGILVGDVAAFVWLRKRHDFRFIRVRWGEGVRLVRNSVSGMANSGLLVVFLAIDTLSLAALASPRQVAYYAVAWTAVFSVQTLVILVTDAVFPDMVRRWEKGRAHLRELIDRLSVLVIRPSYSGAALVTVVAPSLVRLALGDRYAETATVLRIIVWLIPSGATALLLSFSVLAANRPGSLLKRRIVVVAVAVVGCPVAAAEGGATWVAVVILSCSILELVLFGDLTHSLRTARVATSLLAQIDYFIVPFGVLLLEVNLVGHLPLPVVVATWGFATAATETYRKGSTVMMVVRVLRPTN